MHTMYLIDDEPRHLGHRHIVVGFLLLQKVPDVHEPSPPTIHRKIGKCLPLLGPFLWNW